MRRAAAPVLASGLKAATIATYNRVDTGSSREAFIDQESSTRQRPAAEDPVFPQFSERLGRSPTEAVIIDAVIPRGRPPPLR